MKYTEIAGGHLLNLSDKDLWGQVVNEFEKTPSHAQIIYFKQEYLELYSNDQNKAEAYLYKKDSNLFFLPYLKSVLNQKYTEQICYDFETANGYGGYLTNTEDRGFLKEAWDEFAKHCQRENIIAGLLRFDPLYENHQLYIPSWLEVHRMRDVVILSLDKTEEEVWSNYPPSNRNKIRKAIKNDIVIRSSQGNEDVEVFKKLYFQTMKRQEADEFYYFNDDYFNLLFEQLKESVLLLLAHKDGLPIGGVIVLYSEGDVVYHLSATHSDYRNLGVANLLLHEVILDSVKKGKKVMNFGGGTTNDPQDSLFKFKSIFSKETADFHIGKCLLDEKIYQDICASWELSNPECISKYRNFFLKYRYSN